MTYTNFTNFTAFHFEMVGQVPREIGITIVEGDDIVDEYSWSIKESIADGDNKNCLPFDQIWDKMCRYFGDDFVIAHNIGLHLSILRKELDKYGLTMPEMACACTLDWTKKHIQPTTSDLQSTELGDVCEYLGIEAHPRSTATALIALHVLEKLDICAIEQLELCHMLKPSNAQCGEPLA